MRKPLLRHLLITFVPAAAIIAVMLAAYAIYGIRIRMMTQDPAAIGGIHPLAGVVSNLGILFWCVAATVCLFTAFAQRAQSSRRRFWFLLLPGLVSGYLLLDDLFLLHEHLLPVYLNADEGYVYAVLGATLAVYASVYWRDVLATHLPMLLLGLGFLGGSVFIDMIQDYLSFLGQGRILLEDGFKWLGITGWSSYWVHTAYVEFQRLAARAAAPERVEREDGRGEELLGAPTAV